MIIYFLRDIGVSPISCNSVWDVLEFCVFGDDFYVFSRAMDYILWCQTKDKRCIAFHGMLDVHPEYKTPRIGIIRKDY